MVTLNEHDCLVAFNFCKLFNIAREGSDAAKDCLHCDSISASLFNNHQAGLSHHLFWWKVILTPLALCLILVVNSMGAHVCNE